MRIAYCVLATTVPALSSIAYCVLRIAYGRAHQEPPLGAYCVYAIRNTQYAIRVLAPDPPRVTWGFLYVLGGVPIRYASHVSYMYRACIVHVFRCVPFRYIKIHQDTSRYIKIHLCICHFGHHRQCISYLGICILLYDTFRIHLGYIQDTMYLNPQIHDTQDTFTIHRDPQG